MADDKLGERHTNCHDLQCNREGPKQMSSFLAARASRYCLNTRSFILWPHEEQSCWRRNFCWKCWTNLTTYRHSFPAMFFAHWYRTRNYKPKNPTITLHRLAWPRCAHRPVPRVIQTDVWDIPLYVVEVRAVGESNRTLQCWNRSYRHDYRTCTFSDTIVVPKNLVDPWPSNQRLLYYPPAERAKVPLSANAWLVWIHSWLPTQISSWNKLLSSLSISNSLSLPEVQLVENCAIRTPVQVRFDFDQKFDLDSELEEEGALGLEWKFQISNQKSFKTDMI